MSSQLSTSIDRPIKSAVLLSDCLSGWAARESHSGSDAQTSEPHMQVVSQEAMEQLENQMGLFVRANETLNALVAHLNGYLSELLAKHKEEIAELSVEIAKRVLSQRIEDGDYEIEQVVKEAIGDLPADDNVTVHLNAEDLALLQAARTESGQGAQPANVRFLADADVGRAECVVETSRGLVESRINEKLEQISSALKKAQ